MAKTADEASDALKGLLAIARRLEGVSEDQAREVIDWLIEVATGGKASAPLDSLTAIAQALASHFENQ